jgi:hypothetical protein
LLFMLQAARLMCCALSSAAAEPPPTAGAGGTQDMEVDMEGHMGPAQEQVLVR